MSALIKDKDGVEIEVYLEETGGMVDVLLRADTETDWIEGAIYYGLLLVKETTETDEETGVVTILSTEIVPAPGVEIDVLGPVVVTDATYDAQGVQLTPPVMDPRHHVNLRLHREAITKMDPDGDKKWHRMAKNWSVLGVDDLGKNKSEKGKKLSKVTALDPATIMTRIRIYL